MSRKKPNLKSRKFSQVLPCVLDSKACAERGVELAKICQDIPGIEDEKKLSAKQFQERLDALYAKQQELAKQVRESAEEKNVECEEVIDLGAGTLKVIRLDTGAILETRKLKDEELQAELNLGKHEGE